ncbi:MAG: DUF4238 domain-containing protein [Ignavibacteria bacterium]|jgi:hypothetical protein
MGDEPKRHHYLPKFYLKGFTKDDKLWIYDRQRNEFRAQTPINTAIEKDYYSFIDKNGKKNTSVEKILSDVEGRVIPVITDIKNEKRISNEGKGIMSLFLSFFIYRVPEYEKLSNEIAKTISDLTIKNLIFSKEQAKKFIKKYESDTGKSLNVSPEIIYEYAQNAQFEIILDRNTTLKQMLDFSMNNKDWLFNLNWVVLQAPEITSFITSDNPFVLLPPMGFPIGIRGYGLKTKGVTMIIPLSKEQCITIGAPGNSFSYINIKRKTVRDINLYVASRCDRFVIARDEELLKSIVKKTKINKWKKIKRLNI